MKTKIITVLLSFFCLLSACKKENPPPPEENVFDPNAKLSISIPHHSPQNSIQSFSDSISKEKARFLLDHGYKIQMTCYVDVDLGIDKEPYHTSVALAIMGREDLYYKQRDTVNIKYLFWNNSVIQFDQKGENPHLGALATSEDFVLVTIKDSVGNLINLPADLTWEHVDNPRFDTIAYIPNEVMRSGKKQLGAALARKDYEEFYRIFNDFYKFTPITGAEYMELVRQGKN